MSTDHILVLVGSVAIIILLSLWVKIRGLENDFTDETKKMDPYSEKQEWDRWWTVKSNSLYPQEQAIDSIGLSCNMKAEPVIRNSQSCIRYGG